MATEAKVVGVICSSGGSAYLSALDCLAGTPYTLKTHVIIDRSCGMADAAKQRGLACQHIEYATKDSFSQAAAEQLQQVGCKHAILFYSRLVAPAAFLERGISIHNIHPALLPAFPGMSAVRKAYKHGVGILGSTLHEVDDGVDTGPIVAQVATGISRIETEDAWDHISYLQKVFLTLVWFEHCVLATDDQPRTADWQPVGPAVAAGNIGLGNQQLLRNFQQLT